MIDDEFIFADAEMDLFEEPEPKEQNKPEPEQEPEPKTENMTSNQKELALQVYLSIKPAIANILYNTIPNTVKITKMITQIMKQLEIITDKPSGIDKNIVTIKLCSIFIKEFKCNIFLTSEMIETIIEDIIDVSKVINVPTNPTNPTILQPQTNPNVEINIITEKKIFKRLKWCPNLFRKT